MAHSFGSFLFRDLLPSLFFLGNVETNVRIQTVSAPETTDEWPKIGATPWSETNKPDYLKRMSTGSFALVTLHVISCVPRNSSLCVVRTQWLFPNTLLWPVTDRLLVREAWRDKLRFQVQDGGTEATELIPLEWLSEHICQHVTRWTIFNSQFLRLDPVRYKKISDVDVPSSTTT